MMTDDEELWPERNIKFRRIKTILPITFELLFITALEIITIFLVIIKTSYFNEKCLSYFTLFYIHCVHWFVSLLIDIVLRNEHQTIRLNGYLEFYRNTLIHHRIQFYIVSLWTVALLFIQTIIQQFYLDQLEQHCVNNSYLTPQHFYLALITLEFVVLFIVIITYLNKIFMFNKLRPLPDVQKDEWQFNSVNNSISFNADEIGHGIQQDQQREDLLEKQADLIHYLREHNEKLCEKVMLLNAQLQILST